MSSPSTPFKPPSRRAIRRVHDLLVQHYGSRRVKERDPLDGLILIMLSQATSDVNCDRAFSSLKAQFPTWDKVLDAPVEAIADAIRSGGLANQKAARIKQLLREIHQEQGDLDLSWMFAATPDECREYLSSFHGVGPKTVACVLVFFLNKPAFPVDTHVHRVTKRLGWIREKAGAEEAHRVLESAIPDEWKLDLHVNLISHGRAICRAAGNGGPRCDECFLRRLCAYGKTHSVTVQSRHAARTAVADDGSDFFVTVEPSHSGIRHKS
jgi:endonuclease-3